jgi:tRNA 2-thiocytidine biosynthesis protein TtcA
MANRFLRRGEAAEIVRKLTAKAVIDYGLIDDGDRILIAASGGKDSTTLAWALSQLKKSLPRYELAALHISSDFCACCQKGKLAAYLAGWDIPFTDLSVPIVGRLKEGRKMNCYWCSTQRRTELLRYAMEKGFNKIALGHHLDDIVETFFMNLTAKGKIETMPVKLAYLKYPVALIRPLALLEERQVIAAADSLGLLKAACTCPYGLNSGRRVMREKIAAFLGSAEEAGAVKRRILAAGR